MKTFVTAADLGAPPSNILKGSPRGKVHLCHIATPNAGCGEWPRPGSGWRVVLRADVADLCGRCFRDLPKTYREEQP